MKFGFDIDGTITAAPTPFAHIMRALVDAGHEVIVLTGQTHPITEKDWEFRINQLKNIGLNPETEWTDLFIAGPPDWVKDKADYCRNKKVDFMFENDPAYSQAISEFTPTTVMWVHK